MGGQRYSLVRDCKGGRRLMGRGERLLKEGGKKVFSVGVREIRPRRWRRPNTQMLENQKKFQNWKREKLEKGGEVGSRGWEGRLKGRKPFGT